MKSTIFLTAFILLALDATAQQEISGTIRDRKGQPIGYANIYIEGSYDGTTSDSTGHFSLQSDLSGSQLLVASFIGYERYAAEIMLHGRDTALFIILREKVSEINEVAITAGVFSASDRKKSATLSSFDIATTASAVGDIFGAFATMPGSQKVGEEGKLFVRGGESYETKTYMDGMWVQSPYFSKMPDVPTRGRFSPLLFSETLFSTGGYSAEYGGALSSIVDLTTNGLETENKASISLMTVGASASLARRWENASLAMTGMYCDNTLQHMLFKPNMDWIRDPLMGDGMVMYRQKIGETGLLKSYCSYNYGSMEMWYDPIEQGTLDRIGMSTHTVCANSTYTGTLGKNWLIRSGAAYSLDRQHMRYNGDPVITSNAALQAKMVLTRPLTEKFKLRMGGDVIHERYDQLVEMEGTYLFSLMDEQPSLFLESEITLSRKIALRLGARSSYSSLLDELNVSPRVSAAFKTGTFSQISLAWGKFMQKPGNGYLQFAPSLSSEKAAHYILNFQYRKHRRIFRIEAYAKTYDQLVRFSAPYSPYPDDYDNEGYGYATGLDVFWRDRETLEGLDYWISYSFLDSERYYRDFRERAVPSFASAHNLSVVCKYFFRNLDTFAGINYSFASGRPFDDRNSETFMDGKTRPYHDISLSITYLTRLFGKECVIHMNITNLFGFRNVFGYRYSGTPGEDGLYSSRAVVPATGRQAILLLMISL
jgi:vitamin B12 transporter